VNRKASKKWEEGVKSEFTVYEPEGRGEENKMIKAFLQGGREDEIARLGGINNK